MSLFLLQAPAGEPGLALLAEMAQPRKRSPTLQVLFMGVRFAHMSLAKIRHMTESGRGMADYIVKVDTARGKELEPLSIPPCGCGQLSSFSTEGEPFTAKCLYFLGI